MYIYCNTTNQQQYVVKQDDHCYPCHKQQQNEKGNKKIHKERLIHGGIEMLLSSLAL